MFFDLKTPTCRPTLRAVDAAGAASGLGAIFMRGGVPSAVPVQTPASGATDAVRWAAPQPVWLMSNNRTDIRNSLSLTVPIGRLKNVIIIQNWKGQTKVVHYVNH